MEVKINNWETIGLAIETRDFYKKEPIFPPSGLTIFPNFLGSI